MRAPCEACGRTLCIHTAGLCGACHVASQKILISLGHLEPKICSECLRQTHAVVKTKCRVCRQRERRRSDESLLERGRVQCRKWHAANKETRIKKMAEYRANNQERFRAYHWRDRGADIEGCLGLLRQNIDSCQICKKHESQQKVALHIDHNHRTGEARGVLCTGCNRIVGLIENGKTRRNYPKHIAYIKFHENQQKKKEAA